MTSPRSPSDPSTLAAHSLSARHLGVWASPIVLLFCLETYRLLASVELASSPHAIRVLLASLGLSLTVITAWMFQAHLLRMTVPTLTSSTSKEHLGLTDPPIDRGTAADRLEERVADSARELRVLSMALSQSEDRGDRMQEDHHGLESAAAEGKQVLESRTLQLELRTSQLETANRDLEAFSYSVSHDLRAPLRAISGFAEILVRRHSASLDDQGHHYLGNIVQASENMGMLIDDLLKYCRLGRAALVLRDTDTGAILNRIFKDHSERIDTSGGRLLLATPFPVIRGDATLLGQIFGNYIDNAVKYSGEGKSPDISVSATLGDDTWTFAVVDHGIGIEPDQLEKIFEPFQRLHSYDAYPGTGIGLALVRKAAEMLGGRVWAESSSAGGSTFFFRLPAGPANVLAGTTGPMP